MENNVREVFSVGYKYLGQMVSQGSAIEIQLQKKDSLVAATGATSDCPYIAQLQKMGPDTDLTDLQKL